MASLSFDKGICPKCNSRCIIPCNGGMRCNQCGLQLRAVFTIENKSYTSYPSPVIKQEEEEVKVEAKPEVKVETKKVTATSKEQSA